MGISKTIRQGLEKALENVETAKKAGKPITVWHGSPHKFKQFDFSKIGDTGSTVEVIREVIKEVPVEARATASQEVP